MVKQLNKKEKVSATLLVISCCFIIVGILFLVNAIQENPENGFFTAYSAIENVLAKYIIVIAFMSAGIMMFSNAALGFTNKKLRNGLTIGITAFAFILTLPLVYVFIALIPYGVSGAMGAVGRFMGVDRIMTGFTAWFGADALLWVVLSVMLVVSIVFLLFPLCTGILAVKGKTIKIGKQSNGKFGIGFAPLPVLAATDKEDVASEFNRGCAAEAAADEE